MTELLTFMGNHPWLTFFMTYILGEVAFRIINRILRTIKVLFRGWPPAHLDADGDWKPEKDAK